MYIAYVIHVRCYGYIYVAMLCVETEKRIKLSCVSKS